MLKLLSRLAMVVAIFLTAVPTTQAGKPANSTGGGTIYFNASGLGFASMNSDGSGKTSLPVLGGEPSRLLHAGQRWFFSFRPIAGEFYPDGGQRHELFADRNDGAVSVQLTNDPDLEYFGSARWEVGDQAMSWIARRWDSAVSGQVIDSGIYESALLFDMNGDIAGLSQQPLLPLVPTDLVLDGNANVIPDIRSYDWSPDGVSIVSDRQSGKQLWITNAVTGQSSLLVQTTWATVPVWSPNGTAIAFNDYGGIGTIRSNGADLKNIIKRGTGYTVGGPIWSPTGSHLTYARFDNWKSFGFTVYRANADGTGKTSLSGELESAHAIGWR